MEPIRSLPTHEVSCGRYATALYRSVLDHVTGAIAHDLGNQLTVLSMLANDSGRNSLSGAVSRMNVELIDEAVHASLDRIGRLADISTYAYSRAADDGDATGVLYPAVQACRQLLASCFDTVVDVENMPDGAHLCVGTQSCIDTAVHVGLWAAGRAAAEDGRVRVSFWRDESCDENRFARAGMSICLKSTDGRGMNLPDPVECSTSQFGAFRFGVRDAIAIAALSGGGGNILDEGRRLELFWRSGNLPVARGADYEHVVAVIAIPQNALELQERLSPFYRVTEPASLADAIADPRVLTLAGRVDCQWTDRAMLNQLRFRIARDRGFRLLPLVADDLDAAFIDLEFGREIKPLRLPADAGMLASRIEEPATKENP